MFLFFSEMIFLVRKNLGGFDSDHRSRSAGHALWIISLLQDFYRLLTNLVLTWITKFENMTFREKVISDYRLNQLVCIDVWLFLVWLGRWNNLFRRKFAPFEHARDGGPIRTFLLPVYWVSRFLLKNDMPSRASPAPLTTPFHLSSTTTCGLWIRAFSVQKLQGQKINGRRT